MAVTLFLVISDKVSPSPVGCAAAAIHLILSSAFSFSSPVADQLPYIIIAIGQKEKYVCLLLNIGWGGRELFRKVNKWKNMFEGGLSGAEGRSGELTRDIGH